MPKFLFKSRGPFFVAVLLLALALVFHYSVHATWAVAGINVGVDDLLIAGSTFASFGTLLARGLNEVRTRHAGQEEMT